MRDKDDIESRRFERIRLSHQLGEYVDEFTTIPGITPAAYKHKSTDELRRAFMKKFPCPKREENKNGWPS